MAERAKRTKRATSSGNGNGNGAERETRRLVFKRERVIVVPESVEEIDYKALGATGEVAEAESWPVAEAWMQVAEVTADTKRQAIEKYAGKPNTATAKPGTYRAPTQTAWSDGRRYDKPLEPKVEVVDLA